MKCDICAIESSDRARFCQHCGASFTPGAVPVGTAGDAERRQLTVMFSDLVGSTALARALDAEDYRDLLNEYQAVCRDVVGEFEGHVAQYLGDGVMVYFGYPEAHEDDPRRATQAALRILEGTKALTQRLDVSVPMTLQVRVGIHTGTVVVGQLGVGHQRLALGEAPNLAARLQQLAEPNSVVVSDATQKLIARHFLTRSLGRVNVKGFDEPVALHAVIAETGAQRVLRASPSAMVGRELETAQLEQQWEAVVQTRTLRAAVLTGEPGIGKSHLAQALKQKLAARCTVLEGSCSPLHQNAMLRPIAAALESAARLNAVADPARRFTALREYVAQLELPEEVTVFLAPVLSVPVPDELAQASLAPQVRRQRTMSSLAAWLRALARSAPVLLLIEDLQWADPSTLELLASYVSSSDGGPLLVMVTTRPELVLDWPVVCTSTIALPRLSRVHAERLIERGAQYRVLPPAVQSRILELADGVPLYLEEVTKAILESNALRLAEDHYELLSALPEAVVPATVQDSLVARLDRTGDGKAVAQLAAVLGREFSDRVLRAVALMDDSALSAGLRRLIEAELILPGTESGERTYIFKHALIQETAYHSLLKRRRQQYHHRAASVLRDLFPETAETQPHLVALHYAKAGLSDPASTYFERAGSRAFGSQAYTESISHFGSALSELQLAPHSQDRDRRELEILTGLGLPLLMTKGYAATEVESVYDRALALCSELSPPLRVLFGIWGVQFTRGDLVASERMVARFEQLAQNSRDPGERLIVLAAIGSRAFWCGTIAKASAVLESATREFEPEMLAKLPRDYGYDNALYPHLYLSWTQYVAGRFAEAEATWEALWELTLRANTPYFTVMALSFGSTIAADIGDVERTRELAARGIALAAEHQLAFWHASCQVQYGTAECQRSNSVEGISAIEQGIALYRAVGAFTGLSVASARLAEAYLGAGAIDKGLDTVEGALALAETKFDRLAVPQLLRVKAQLLLRLSGRDAEAEACFRAAIEAASKSGAVLFQLHAATDYTRYLMTRGGSADAAVLLDGACRAVASGETPRLRAAKGLLATLARDGSPTPEARG